MPWTEVARREYSRRFSRYASDTKDKVWAKIVPFMPPPKRVGRPRTTDLRAVFDAILYIATTGCQWNTLPVAWTDQPRDTRWAHPTPRLVPKCFDKRLEPVRKIIMPVIIHRRSPTKPTPHESRNSPHGIP